MVAPAVLKVDQEGSFGSCRPSALLGTTNGLRDMELQASGRNGGRQFCREGGRYLNCRRCK